MRLTEFIVCLGISLLILTSCFMLLLSGSKTANVLTLQYSNTNKVIETDLLIRDKIEAIKIPYTKNSNKKGEEYRKQILNLHLKNITITECNDIKDQYGFTEGFEVKWFFNGKEYVTKSLFRSRGLKEK